MTLGELPPYLSVQDVAIYLGVSDRTVREMVEAGTLRGIRLYTARTTRQKPCVRITRESLYLYFAKHGCSKEQIEENFLLVARELTTVDLTRLIIKLSTYNNNRKRHASAFTSS